MPDVSMLQDLPPLHPCLQYCVLLSSKGMLEFGVEQLES